MIEWEKLQYILCATPYNRYWVKGNFFQFHFLLTSELHVLDGGVGFCPLLISIFIYTAFYCLPVRSNEPNWSDLSTVSLLQEPSKALHIVMKPAVACAQRVLPHWSSWSQKAIYTLDFYLKTSFSAWQWLFHHHVSCDTSSSGISAEFWIPKKSQGSETPGTHCHDWLSASPVWHH